MKGRFLIGILLARLALANPTGENVARGEASFFRPDEKQLYVLQNSDRAVVEWQQFSIDADEMMKIVQPRADSVLLNKVMGQDLSAIYGRLESNGQVVLVNPHGVLVGESGVIDTSAFFSSTQEISYDTFMKGAGGFTPSDFSSFINTEDRIEAGAVRKVGNRVFLVANELSTQNELEIESSIEVGSDTEKTLEALQQLRSLIPERIWCQEFSILIDEKAFDQPLKLLMDRFASKGAVQSFSLARSKYYFLRSTLSGENVRILDWYQEFEQSPFWRTPSLSPSQ